MRVSLVLILAVLFLAGCSEKNYTIVNDYGDGSDIPVEFAVTPTKWQGGRTAALSITYDGGLKQASSIEISDGIVQDAYTRGLPMEFEMVTATYEPWPVTTDAIREEVLPLGMVVFGHGHTHTNHDLLTYEEAYTSFRTCYTLMESWGLNSGAYAYPGGDGKEYETQLACREAGFLCARGFKTPDKYTCAGDEREPENWYLLPSISVAPEYDGYVRSHNEVVTILEDVLDNTAWTTITYHSVGQPGLWGYYPHEQFIQDLDYIASKDFWCGHMGEVARYIKERNRLTAVAEAVSSTSVSIDAVLILSDNLDNAVYNEPLTLDVKLDTDVTIVGAEFTDERLSAIPITVTNNTLRFDAVPDESLRHLRLYYSK